MCISSMTARTTGCSRAAGPCATPRRRRDDRRGAAGRAADASSCRSSVRSVLLGRRSSATPAPVRRRFRIETCSTEQAGRSIRRLRPDAATRTRAGAGREDPSRGWRGARVRVRCAAMLPFPRCNARATPSTWRRCTATTCRLAPMRAPVSSPAVDAGSFLVMAPVPLRRLEDVREPQHRRSRTCAISIADAAQALARSTRSASSRTSPAMGIGAARPGTHGTRR